MKLKMKQLEKAAMVTLSLILAVGLFSCNNDDEPTPSVKKRMRSVDDTSFVTSFVYSNGKISKEIESYGLTWDIQYLASSIVFKDEDDDREVTYNLTNGLISSYYPYEDEGHKFTYENGRLKIWDKYLDGTLDEEIQFEWKDDIITRQTVYYFSEGEKKIECDYHYTYNNEFDYGGSIACFQSDFLFYDDLPISLIVQGYFGKLPKYLVSSAIDEGGYFGKKDFNYSFDNDGYPTSIRGGYNSKITWENVK